MSCNSLSHITAVVDFYINQGAYWETDFDLVDDDDVVMDLEGCSIAGVARRDRKAGTPVAYTFRFRIEVEEKRIYAWLEEEDTMNLIIGPRAIDEKSTFYYDWELTDSLGRVHRIQQGKNWIDQNQTRDAVLLGIGSMVVGSSFVIG